MAYLYWHNYKMSLVKYINLLCPRESHTHSANFISNKQYPDGCLYLINNTQMVVLFVSQI